MSSRAMPAPRPNVKIATMTAISSAITGVPSTSRTRRTRFSSSSSMMSASALPIISTTGSSTVASVIGNDGRCSSSSESRASNRSGAGTGTQRAANGREQRSGDHDGRDRDQHAESQGGAEVGAQRVDGDQRAGVRRHQSVHRREAGQGRDADRDQRELRAAGDQVDHRHQQHQADLEEHRQADDRADQRHRPRQHPRAGPADDRVHDLVGTAGVGEQLGEHRAQCDQDADTRGGRHRSRC